MFIFLVESVDFQLNVQKLEMHHLVVSLRNLAPGGEKCDFQGWVIVEFFNSSAKVNVDRRRTSGDD